MDFMYHFPAVKGLQGGEDYYIAMIPLKMIPRLFPADEEEYVPPECRAQRKLNERRVPEIRRYILENRNSYVFSALAASIDGEFRFAPSADNQSLGTLEVSMDARFLINDGQHRKAAIISALTEDESLQDETIAVVLYKDLGLRRAQQIFTDLNKHAVKTSNSISELYDSRDALAVATKEAISNVSFLDQYTDKEKDILGKYSSKLFTLNMFYSANKLILGGHDVTKAEEMFLHDFWGSVAANMLPWKALQINKLSKVKLREQYIAVQGIVIQAFGLVGADLYKDGIKCSRALLKGVTRIDWSRENKKWFMRAINEKGHVITNKTAARLISNVIKQAISLPLTADDEKLEQKHETIVKQFIDAPKANGRTGNNNVVEG